MQIHWKTKRFDESEEQDPSLSDCLLRFEGRVEIDGQPAGTVEAWYVFADLLDADRAFRELWDLEAYPCSVFGQIVRDDRRGFREPLPKLLAEDPGILIIEHVALRPAFRGKGIGQTVIRETVGACADNRVGAVLLDATPLQHRPGACDWYDDEIRELPWNEGEMDHDRLRNHFRTHGMQRLPRTRYMIAARETMGEVRPEMWPTGWEEDENEPDGVDGSDDDDVPF